MYSTSASLILLSSLHTLRFVISHCFSPLHLHFTLSRASVLVVLRERTFILPFSHCRASSQILAEDMGWVLRWKLNCFSLKKITFIAWFWALPVFTSCSWPSHSYSLSFSLNPAHLLSSLVALVTSTRHSKTQYLISVNDLWITQAPWATDKIWA